MTNGTAVNSQIHSHDERWRLCSSVPRYAYDVADEIRTMLRVTKASLFAIGARALTPLGASDCSEVAEIADRLSNRCQTSERRLVFDNEQNQLRPLLQEVVKALQLLDVWTRALVDAHGVVSSEIAAGLRDSYSNLRRAADPFWELELVPEGRT